MTAARSGCGDNAGGLRLGGAGTPHHPRGPHCGAGGISIGDPWFVPSPSQGTGDMSLVGLSCCHDRGVTICGVGTPMGTQGLVLWWPRTGQGQTGRVAWPGWGGGTTVAGVLSGTAVSPSLAGHRGVPELPGVAARGVFGGGVTPSPAPRSRLLFRSGPRAAAGARSGRAATFISPAAH